MSSEQQPTQADRLDHLERLTEAIGQQSSAVAVLVGLHEKRQRGIEVSEAEEVAALAAIELTGKVADRYLEVSRDARASEAAESALRDARG